MDDSDVREICENSLLNILSEYGKVCSDLALIRHQCEIVERARKELTVEILRLQKRIQELEAQHGT